MATCAACHGKLELEIEHEDGMRDDKTTEGSSASNINITTVPDDVELNCGCHFHW